MAALESARWKARECARKSTCVGALLSHAHERESVYGCPRVRTRERACVAAPESARERARESALERACVAALLSSTHASECVHGCHEEHAKESARECVRDCI